MSKKLKNLMAAEYQSMLDDVQACVVVGYEGLTAEQSHQLRGELQKDPPVTMHVVKNSIARLALQRAGFEGLEEELDGPSAIAFGGEDPVDLTKRLTDWSKKLKALKVRGGYLEGRGLLSQDQVVALSKIPPREVLLGQLASAVAGPLRGLAGSLQGIIRKFAYALNAVKEQKAEA